MPKLIHAFLADAERGRNILAGMAIVGVMTIVVTMTVNGQL
jgi:hypothetical protein